MTACPPPMPLENVPFTSILCPLLVNSFRTFCPKRFSIITSQPPNVCLLKRGASSAAWIFILKSTRFATNCACACDCFPPPMIPNTPFLGERRNNCMQRPLSSHQRIWRSCIHAEEPAAIVQRKPRTRCNDARSKSLVIALDKRHHVSLAVDYTQICRVASNRHFSGPRVAVRLVCVNKFGPLRRPLFRKQRRNRQFLFPRVANVSRKIRICQLLCLHHRVQRFRRPKTPILLSQRKCLHDVQHFQRRDALHVRLQLVNRPIAIGSGDRLDKFAGVFGQVLRGHRSVVPLHRVQNLRGNFAFVERLPAVLRDLLKRPGQLGIAKHLAYFRGAVSRKIGLRRHLICPQVVHFGRPVSPRPFRDRESVPRRSNRRRQILCQFLSSKLIRELLPPIHRSRHCDCIHSLLR